MAAKSPSESIIGLYERNAAGWVEDRGTDLHERLWLDRFAAPLSPEATILDIGCGSGDPIARHFVNRGFTVTGVDTSPSLIGIARDKLSSAEWIVADMRALDLDRRFDALIAWHSFFHLTPEDQRPMFARFAAHAACRAMLMFTSGPAHGEKIGSWRGEPLYHGSLHPSEYARLLTENGFEVLDFSPDDALTGGGTIWLARHLA